MTDLREAAQMALDALDSDNPDIQLRAATHLRAALAQPEQEPVAYWRHTSSINQGWDEFSATKAFDDDIPLYTAPPQREWQGLTDEEVLQEADKRHARINNNIGNDLLLISFYRAIEAKLKEKNT